MFSDLNDGTTNFCMLCEQTASERDHYKERCATLEKAISEWLSACPTNKDGHLISFLAKRAQKVLQDTAPGKCGICEGPGTPCVFCAQGICKAVFCSEHKYTHERCAVT